jgi:hypothetical protein
MRFAASLILVGLLAATPAAGGERDEQVLAWDDGGPVHAMYPYPAEGRKVAVMFHAPEGFIWLRTIRCYICNDQVVDPDNPWLPTTGPCILSVWGPQEVGGDLVPGPVPVYEFDSGEHYPEDMWDDFVLPEPGDLSDTAAFPEGVFFVGIQWLSIYDPILGYDWDPVVAGYSWETFSTDWVQSTEATAMIRAVVSDSSGTPAELESWGSIKAAFREQRTRVPN